MKTITRIFFLCTLVFALAAPSFAAVGSWSGSTPFATGVGNSNITAVFVRHDGSAVFAGNLSGTLLGYEYNVTASSAPSNIEVQSPTIKGQLTLTWTKPADADFIHVHVYRSATEGALGALIADNLTGMKYTDTGLASQTKYYYTIRAMYGVGTESTNTAQASGTTLSVDITPPAYVTGGTATNLNTGGRLNLSWTASTASDLSHYHIYRSDNGFTYELVHDNVVGTNYTDSGLTNGQQYWYSFTAIDTSNNESTQSSAHGIVRGTPTAPDLAPPGLISCTGTITQPTPLTGDKLQLNWVNPATDYALTRVYASTASGTLGSMIYEGNDNKFLHTGLTRNVSYYYTYRSVDAFNNENPDNSQCSFIPLDQVPAACPAELSVVRNVNDTVTLNWLRSASADIFSYQIFASDGTNPINYTTPAATVNQPILTWTSAVLTQGKTYQFGLRTIDNQPTTPNSSDNCGVISVTIPNPAPDCNVSTSIKVPHAGKKLGGNRTTVIAEVTTGSESNLESVKFQYRASGLANIWLDIPTTNGTTFPNPDSTKPYFVHWNISGTGSNLTAGDYDIRAVATCKVSNEDLTPNYITVTVPANPNEAESDERDNVNGEQVKTEKVGGEADSTVAKGDDNGNKVTKLLLPAGSTPEGTTVTVTESNPVTKAALVPTDHQSGGTFRDISFVPARHVLDNNKKADLEIPYKDDAPADGIVDGTTINVYDLQLCDYDPSQSKWLCLESTVDTIAKTVKAKTNSFSLYGLLVPPKVVGSGWNMLSVPLTPTDSSAGAIFNPVSVYANYFPVYNPTTEQFDFAATVVPGKGYFIKGNGRSFTASGTETADAPFNIAIKKGWNMIGNPFRYKVKVANLGISYNSSNYILAAAEAAGLVDGTLFGSVNGAFVMSTILNGGTIDPWKGYYILSDVDCTLVVPNTPAL